MLFNTFRKAKYNYTAEYYGYTLVTSADGTVTTREYVTIPTGILMGLSTSFIGDLIILTDQKMQINGYLKNVLDRNGKEIYVDGIWQITSTQPVLNALGIVEGYKYKAKLIDGEV